jgi:hypothetical protein
MPGSPTKGHFDLWGCAHPACNEAVYEGLQCRGCKSVSCPHHLAAPSPPLYLFTPRGMSICKYCDAYMCLVGECGGGRASQILP